MTDSTRITARVTETDDRTEHIRILRVVTETPLHYNAGQYIRVSAPEFEPRFFSVGCAPKKEGMIDLHIRNAGQGLSQHLSKNIAIGDAVHIEGPFGKMTSISAQERPSLMIGGGTGIAPCIALAQDILRKGLSEDIIHILYGVKEEKDIYCQKELNVLRATGQVDVTYCIGTDTPDHAITRLSPILDHHAIYISGPDAMMHNLYPVLRAHGAEKERIFSDTEYMDHEA